jgi:phosphoglycolate phosphatase-like HAD superfamily hydrolase
VEDYVARLTGEQTIYQMIELARQVERRGGKPQDPVAYKRMYHDRLMERIAWRREELRQEKVPPEKYLVPGARALLEALKDRGLKLYCASGTDQFYTQEEARLLDVARYFEGGVYGALDDYRSFSKEILIRRIISSAECQGEEFLGFGDGYVEIKNIKEVGGVAVGVATAEPECRVVDEWKRKRLVSVGADFIIPNFLCHEPLLHALFPN